MGLPTIKSKLFQTSSFEELGISPGSLKVTLEEAEDRILQDGILDEFPGSKDDENAEFRSCILFLYAGEFFWKLTKEERISKIKQCLDRQSGSYKRLRMLAFSDSTDKVSFGETCFGLYFDMASTARIFFAQQNVVGGFPREPFERVQSSSCCYMVSACVWYSLQLQADLPEVPEEPIDVSHFARRTMNSDYKLEKRVVENVGGSSFELVKELTGRTHEDDWIKLQFHKSNVDLSGLCSIALGFLEKRRLGLVTGFIVTSNFKNRAQDRQRRGMGYWRFDAIDIDCEGEFVTVQEDDKCEAERARLHNHWQDQKTQAENKSKKRREFVALPSPTHLFSADDVDAKESAVVENELTRASATSIPPGAEPEPRHSMVMLGGYKVVENDQPKHYFMLMNWWRGMPLVVVSADYLRACQCRVVFLDEKLTKNSQMDRKHALFAEAVCPDQGEDVSAIGASFDSLECQTYEE